MSFKAVGGIKQHEQTRTVARYMMLRSFRIAASAASSPSSFPLTWMHSLMAASHPLTGGVDCCSLAAAAEHFRRVSGVGGCPDDQEGGAFMAIDVDPAGCVPGGACECRRWS